MNPACVVASDELIAFTEEDLPEGRMKELEAHVPSCPNCQERLAGARETMSLLRETMPAPHDDARHDLLVRLYQETSHQTHHPHREWKQVASLTAICGTFLLAAVLLWSGVSQFVDAIPRPFQQASLDQNLEWVTDDQDAAAEMFETAPLPTSLGEGYPVYDHWIRAEIRVIVYQDGNNGPTVIEVSQFFVDDPKPPGYMEEISTVDGRSVYVDDPAHIREIRWTEGDLAYHVQIYTTDTGDGGQLTMDEAERIVQAFLDEEGGSCGRNTDQTVSLQPAA